MCRQKYWQESRILNDHIVSYYYVHSTNNNGLGLSDITHNKQIVPMHPLLLTEVARVPFLDKHTCMADQ